MKKVNVLVGIAACLVLGNMGYSRTIAYPYEVGTWPGWRSGAVSFTFDDGCANQFALALPMFNEFGFKLTLFTITSWSPNWIALQEAAMKGHEVASHTVTHPSLAGLTMEQQTTELKSSRDDIDAHIEGPNCVTIAYPYCNVGNVALCTQYYIAARGCQGFVEGSTPGDFLNISSIICGNQGSVQTAASLNGQCNAAATAKGWCVFLIHGIDNDGGYSPLASSELRSSLQYLAEHKSTLWVQTFGNVVRYIRERDTASLTEVSVEDSRIVVQVTDSLDDAIYNYPLTFRRPLPAGWPSARVTQNGKIVPVQMAVLGRGSKGILFDVVPDGGEIVLSKAPAPPTGLTASVADPNNVTLDWNDNTEPNLAGYNVYRSTASGSAYGKVNDAPVSASAYTDPNTARDTTFYYVVTAVDANSSESGYSNEASAGVFRDPTAGPR
jgi:peptidoglycan/xylan/chitin deacetylase (PgdA/CDA1 family)